VSSQTSGPRQKGEETRVQQLGTEREVAAMRRAITLAERGLGSTSPNPIVGCVILDADHRVVAEGFHARAGGPHAEVVALAEAGERARGGTAVVTLEPCRHTGRTGPCTTALVDAGIARVVYATADPNPLAQHGAELLRAAGVEVAAGLLADEVARSNEAWLHRARTGRPFVTWKFAATLDGRIAAADGSSRWITSAAAREDVHVLRARSDAVMVGTGTVLADDPALTVRTPVPSPRQPLRVVVGRRSLPPSAKVLDDAAPTLVVAEHDPDLVLKTLGEREIVSVLLEGGPTLAAAFMRAARIDKIVAYLAPAFLGAGRAALADAGISTIADILRWHIDQVDLIGDDVRLIARPNRAGE
jgi:diaminohydroxyphosphoribosylaminopyrimidine deaminase/5-amino-6-(5-phosphoribosylamino)uracil reductase